MPWGSYRANERHFWREPCDYFQLTLNHRLGGILERRLKSLGGFTCVKNDDVRSSAEPS